MPDVTDTRSVVFAVLNAHKRHEYQRDVWLPMFRCECGEVMMANRQRDHLADLIAEALS